MVVLNNFVLRVGMIFRSGGAAELSSGRHHGQWLSGGWYLKKRGGDFFWQDEKKIGAKINSSTVFFSTSWAQIWSSDGLFFCGWAHLRYPRKSVFLQPKVFLWFFQLVEGYTNTQKMGAKFFLFAAVCLCIYIWENCFCWLIDGYTLKNDHFLFVYS